MGDRIFTLGEANGLIPELEQRLVRIRAARQYLVYLKPEIDSARNRADEGGGSPKGPAYVTTLEMIIKELERIQEAGVVVKDLERGLCDFPFLQDGDVVYLCWKLGETEIRWWHSLDSGFASRKPLDSHEH